MASKRWIMTILKDGDINYQVKISNKKGVGIKTPSASVYHTLPVVLGTDT